MALQKQNVPLNFGQGLDTKTDPFQVKAGKFLALENVIFGKGGLLQKRNGFGPLPSVSNNPSYLSTYAGNLAAVGTTLQILSQDTGQWLNRGSIQPVALSVIPAVRTSKNQTAADVAVAPNGLACACYVDAGGAYYQILDSASGQILVSQTALPATAVAPRAFSVGNYFFVTFLATVAATPHLQYIAIPIGNPTNPLAAADISTQVSSLAAGYDAFSSGGNLFVAWNGSDGGGAIRSTFIDAQLSQHNTKTLATFTSQLMSVTVDSSGTNPVMWLTFWNSGDTKTYSAAYTVTGQLTALLAPTQTIAATAVVALTSTAVGGSIRIFYETSSTYSYSSTRSDFLSSVTCSQGGSVGSPSVVLRSVGLASKAFYFSPNQTSYVLVAYAGAFQPTYFLIDQSGNVVAKLAYENGTGYAATQVLPGVTLTGSVAQVGYLFKSQLVSVNAAQGVSAPAGIYSIAGVNLATFTLNTNSSITQEIGNNLHLTGGFLWSYDGAKPVEHQFHLWPEDIGVTTSGSGGLITAQQYYYYAIYAWTDAQGNVHRSAPSIPYGITTSGATSTNTIKIPTLRLTYKTAPNLPRIELYRWSAGQQVPYLVTSITSPTLNDTTVDSVTITDTLADSSILGNPILYTEGGVVEDVAAPACSNAAIFKGRLWVLPAEKPNEPWYSKEVIQATPVEMSDQLTKFIPPNPATKDFPAITAWIQMDEKFIFFHRGAIQFIVGSGPDNTGANNDFSDPVFITSTVGCVNQQSVVLTPKGVMFQSDGKGIWLLGRDLSTTYIGDGVEAYNSSTVQSAVNVPGTNQIRFTLDSGVTLMYDYYYGQWGTFTGVPAISSTVYGGLHAYLNSLGQVFQESPGTYLDNGEPVLISFTTAWLSLAGLQGYQRAYYFLIMGQYLTPHKLVGTIATDYSPYVTQQFTISPNNYAQRFGADPLFGSSSPFAGPSQLEQWRINLLRQTCQAFQITVTEQYDPTLGEPAGAGLTLSGLNLVYGFKKGAAKIAPALATG